jgi:hyaluronoglucosaminidase
MKNIYSVSDKLLFNFFNVDTKGYKIQAYPEIDLKIVHEPSLKDWYRIVVYKSFKIEVFYGNNRSLLYAFEFLSKVKSELETGIYEDGPDFEMRGIIEGFYGSPWSHSDRLDAINFIKKTRMNTYFYAPKDDLYHRELWRELYPKEPLKKLNELISHAQNSNVDFYFCISPGKDFNYSKEEEFDILFKKMNQLIQHRVTHFALLMDDIDYKLNEENALKFKTPGIAHSYITNKLNTYLNNQSKAFSLVMCPTEYWQNWNTDYRKDLKDNLHPDVAVFWTGYNTIAEYIPNIDGEKVKSYFGHPLILWDNYPVNDMTTDRIFLGPLLNRGKDLHRTHFGMVSNPMIEWHLSKVALLTMAEYMWDSHQYNYERSYEHAIKTMTQEQPELYDDFKVFCENNRHSLIHYYKLNDIEDAISTLNYDALDVYFTNTKKAFDRLIKLYKDNAFINQAMPWFKRFDEDVKLFEKIKNNLATEQDTSYIEHSKHTIGSNIVVKLAKKLELYHKDVYKKNRINYWDKN